MCIDALGRLAQGHVADQMPVLIVDLLETVEIDQQTGEPRTLPLRSRQLLLESGMQIPAVVPAGQKIGQPAADQASPVHRVLDGK